MWYLEMLLKSNSKVTPEDTFIEFLINIKDMCERGEISEQQKQRKVKEFANKIYGKV